MEYLARYSRKDFRVDTFASGGPGGQHQNKKQSGCRITHFPTGLAAECREHREYPRNRAEAFRKLAKLIKAYWHEQTATAKVRNDDTVRTYHEPDNRVKDHASGATLSYKEVLRGKGIDTMIAARRTG